jgi:hypothetical protein
LLLLTLLSTEIDARGGARPKLQQAKGFQKVDEQTQVVCSRSRARIERSSKRQKKPNQTIHI